MKRLRDYGTDCLFCSKPEPNYKPAPNVDFLCSQCVTLLLKSSQEELLRAKAKAEEKNNSRKITALNMFITIQEEETDGKRPKRNSGKSGSDFNRSRSDRISRDQQKYIRVPTNRKATAVL